MKKIKKINFSKKDLRNLIPYPDKSCNKYSRGTCIVLAGSKKFPGAAVLACHGAQRMGSGYTKLYTYKDVVKHAAFSMPSCPVSSFEEFTCKQDFDKNKPHAYLVGPGFEVSNSSNKNICLEILSQASSPVVMDGGALATLKNEKIRDCLNNRSDNNLETILTPHKGEALRIFEFYNEAMPKSLEKAAIELSKLTNSIIVLKDFNTYVCDGASIYFMKGENPALAKAGSGDVLAGMITGILCQNKDSAFECCVLAINLALRAAKLAAKDLGAISVIPEDVIKYISKSMV